MAPHPTGAATPLVRHLQTLVPPNSRTALCTSVLPAVLDAIADIARALRGAQHVSAAGTANAFGDAQLNVDVAAESIMRAALARCPAVRTASSEEDPVERPAGSGNDDDDDDKTQTETYTVAFDPLDGSSIIAPNWAVGTIVGVWDGATALGQPPRERQVAAVLGALGPRATAVVAVRVPGAEPACIEVGLGCASASASATAGDGTEAERGGREWEREWAWEVLRPTVRLPGPPFATRYFAPANLRAAADDHDDDDDDSTGRRYLALVTRLVRERCTLRYSGGLVPDVVHALVKGHGVYVSPVTAASGAKLRRLFELCPVALVVECAGGRAVDPADGTAILDRALEGCDERAGLVCGTAEEVDAVREALLG